MAVAQTALAITGPTTVGSGLPINLTASGLGVNENCLWEVKSGGGLFLSAGLSSTATFFAPKELAALEEVVVRVWWFDGNNWGTAEKTITVTSAAKKSLLVSSNRQEIFTRHFNVGDILWWRKGGTTYNASFLNSQGDKLVVAINQTGYGVDGGEETYAYSLGEWGLYETADPQLPSRERFNVSGIPEETYYTARYYIDGALTSFPLQAAPIYHDGNILLPKLGFYLINDELWEAKIDGRERVNFGLTDRSTENIAEDDAYVTFLDIREIQFPTGLSPVREGVKVKRYSLIAGLVNGRIIVETGTSAGGVKVDGPGVYFSQTASEYLVLYRKIYSVANYRQEPAEDVFQYCIPADDSLILYFHRDRLILSSVSLKITADVNPLPVEVVGAS